MPSDECAGAPIHVACFFDQDFAWAALVMAASLAEHSDDRAPTVLHAFHSGKLNFDFAAEAARLESDAFSCRIQALEDPFHPEDLIPQTNPAYFLRLEIGDLLDLDRVIYLDTDVLVRASLRPLFDRDLGGKTIAASPDPVIAKAMAEPPRSQQLFLSSVVLRRYVESLVAPSHTYFNSGIMLIDLDRWRKTEVKARCLRFLAERASVVFADQDILNHVLQDEVDYLDYSWNFTCLFLPEDAGLADAKILHFAGAKPFNVLDPPQRNDALYWDFAMTTPFGPGLRSHFHAGYEYHRERLATGLRKGPNQVETPVAAAAEPASSEQPSKRRTFRNWFRDAVQSWTGR